ncbi:AbrB/MazE/SpoVT family DNA-binding domain-containing protein [Phenylobacterium montanum]|uniref:AbrB/MazE/SpoVT family DNA-binding domain-containing protein n=1 Tax=Phenylobacterium montanum TaxID=2823693 RepID=A0A975FYY2_9CAUL|nr:AbrB/MazE/SpoVT family DNA-binding domain-containing protein [Caulobacter sp. S6]QUD87417.1 AbrB/MazE/SpoVT family DNA-binding domain-containing protein [Caulobacter sp. S6]
MAEIAAAHTTVSDKIRALNAEGVPRAEIARFLGKRYQHVRNVLVADAEQGPTYVVGRAELAPVAEAAQPFVHEPVFEQRSGGIYRLVVRDDGVLVLPPAVREALGVPAGGVVMANLSDEEFSVISSAKAGRRAQEMVRATIGTGGPSLVDELIADRRREAAREEADD